MKHKLFLPAIMLLISRVSANSTIGYSTMQNHWLDYYWVPGNILAFHVDYPYDFIIYILAAIGLIWVLSKTWQGIKAWLGVDRK